MDFFVEQTIHAAPQDVADIMFDPARESEWIEKGGNGDMLTPGPLGVGSRVRHEAGVHGWKVAFTTEVKSFEPGRKLEMEVVDGSDQGRIVYQVAPTSGGAIATIHVHDEAGLRFPHSTWARKQQAQENLHRLAQAVMHARA
jgi:hypothetical protein